MLFSRLVRQTLHLPIARVATTFVNAPLPDSGAAHQAHHHLLLGFFGVTTALAAATVDHQHQQALCMKGAKRLPDAPPLSKRASKLARQEKLKEKMKAMRQRRREKENVFFTPPPNSPATTRLKKATTALGTAGTQPGFHFQEFKTDGIGHLNTSSASAAQRKLKFLLNLSVHDEEEDEEDKEMESQTSLPTVSTRLRSSNTSTTMAPRLRLSSPILTLNPHIQLVLTNGKCGWPGHTFYRCKCIVGPRVVSF